MTYQEKKMQLDAYKAHMEGNMNNFFELRDKVNAAFKKYTNKAKEFDEKQDNDAYTLDKDYLFDSFMELKKLAEIVDKYKDQMWKNFKDYIDTEELYHEFHELCQDVE